MPIVSVVVVVVDDVTVRGAVPELGELTKSPLQFPFMVTDAADVGVNVTLQVPKLSIHEFELNEPDPPVNVNDTVPDGSVPVTTTVTVVVLLTLTDDGKRVTVVTVGVSAET